MKEVHCNKRGNQAEEEGLRWRKAREVTSGVRRNDPGSVMQWPRASRGILESTSDPESDTRGMAAGQAPSRSVWRRRRSAAPPHLLLPLVCVLFPRGFATAKGGRSLGWQKIASPRGCFPKGPGMRHRAQSSDAGIPRRCEESFLFPMMLLLTLAKEPTDDATHNSAGRKRQA